MSFVHQIMSRPGAEPIPEPKAEPRPSPTERPSALPDDGDDADFGEEFGHSVKKDGAAGGAGFERDEYDKLV